VGPRAGLDAGARRKICPCRGIEPRSSDLPARSQTLYCLSYRGPAVVEVIFRLRCHVNSESNANYEALDNKVANFKKLFFLFLFTARCMMQEKVILVFGSFNYVKIHMVGKRMVMTSLRCYLQN
jgi:hypothetical protein